MSRPVRPRVHYVNDDHVLALVGPIIVLIARNEPGGDLVKQFQPCVAEIEKRYEGKGGVLTVIRSEVRPPSEAARDRIRKSMRDCQRVCIAGASVIEGEGFVAAANRAALTMMIFATRLSYPMKVYSTLREATVFVCTSLGDSALVKPEELAKSVQEMRDAYTANTLQPSLR